MDREKLKSVCLEFIKTYRYAFLVLLGGIILLCIPGAEAPEESPVKAETIPSEDLASRLSGLLSRMDGAGKVQVLLTEAVGEEVCYQTDEDIDKTDNSSGIRRETIIVTNSEREQTGLVQRVDPPVYLGAVVLCQGADSASVRLALVEAVKSATGLTSDKITVLKMK